MAIARLISEKEHQVEVNIIMSSSKASKDFTKNIERLSDETPFKILIMEGKSKYET